MSLAISPPLLTLLRAYQDLVFALLFSWQASPWLVIRTMRRFLSTVHDPTRDDYNSFVLNTPDLLETWASAVAKSPTLKAYFLAIYSIARLKTGLYKEDPLKSRLVARIRDVRLALKKQTSVLAVGGVAKSALDMLDLAERSAP